MAQRGITIDTLLRVLAAMDAARPIVLALYVDKGGSATLNASVELSCAASALRCEIAAATGAIPVEAEQEAA